MKPNPGLAALVAACTISALGASGALASRLEWRTDSCELSRHRHCSFAPGEAASPHRFVTLRGTLRSFARGDAALYAVYLSQPGDLKPLRARLEREGSPGEWARESEAGSLLGGHASLEWIPIETNGNVVVRVDEARVPGKRWVAVVNAEGEILGAHPLWSGPGPLAAR